MKKFKDKLQNSLGVFGIVLYYAMLFIFAYAPLIVLDFPFWADLIIFAVIAFLPVIYYVTGPIFWIWGLIKVMDGPQDVIAYIYYVGFALWLISIVFQLVIPLIKMIIEKVSKKA